MRQAVLTAGLLLAACGGSPKTTDDPVGQNVAAAAAEGKPAALTAATDCGQAPPDFVPLYTNAKIISCVSGPDGQQDHVSGTIVYVTNAKPAEVLGWSRGQANASGLAQRMATDKMYSAGEERRRSLMVVVDTVDGQTRVTVNWGKDI
ncbi:hypothetical protein IAG41_19225 [Sphingomonas sp. JC676]|uniref:hypothetical protein n=1 Tax=Sphingomonas sp. JC676 TaxID=2768065 RepID=UPI001658448F|nr:hypothetical protein [Sphingomonas sp. JC676]MBC9034525.1 hypothetical protein [Sphingomonas sp. JC676]